MSTRVEVAQIMGTAMSVHLIGRHPSFERAAAACFEELRRVDRVFSPYRPDSDISRIARGELSIEDADADVAVVHAACARAEADTAGLFSAAFGGGFDPTGYVKGWSVERAARTYLAPLLDGVDAVAIGINAGGDMQLFTDPATDWTWNVAIVDPADRTSVVATVPVRDGGVATSGTSERGAHLIAPRTGEPARGAASATVVMRGLADADVWATAAAVAGYDDLSWIEAAGESTGIVLDAAGRSRRWLDGVEISTRTVQPTDV
ncbi:FAD:protein FMN transferase [Microbacterium sp. NPDC012755]|uniref:FAD:protein FMN transferase n=1 Tax=Microbacterium sp. NPDC012755 TaxID=3364184 RepID=UPI00367C7163